VTTRPHPRRATGFLRPRQVTLALLFATGATLAVASLAMAHAVVYPKASRTGAYEKYVLRVPNEKNVPTLRVELHFPADVRVTSFADVAGWQLEVLTDSAKRIVGAVWTGTLAPQRFIEFPFVAANPKVATKVVWPTYQTYADGQRVEWTGAEGTKTPASATTISPMGDSSSAGVTRRIPWLALVIALLSLGLALRRPESTSSMRTSS
jgi:uncharacterized protein YcnI